MTAFDALHNENDGVGMSVVVSLQVKLTPLLLESLFGLSYFDSCSSSLSGIGHDSAYSFNTLSGKLLFRSVCIFDALLLQERLSLCSQISL